MKTIITLIAAAWAALFKKKTGNDAVAVTIPDIAISKEDLNHLIDIVNNIKKVVENPIVIAVADLIPGTVAENVLKLVDGAIVPVMAGITFVSNWLNTSPAQDREVLLNDIINKIHFSDDVAKNGFYHTLFIRLIMAASDGKVTWSEAAQIAELYFVNIFKANK